MKKKVLAVGCHPDDMEFLMAGTLLLLKDSGCEMHYMNLANGDCGTNKLSPAKIRAMRRREAMEAAEYLGAVFHESICSDLAVFYRQRLIRKLTAVIREVQPDIICAMSPEDYMEDHMNTARISVTAAFCRNIKNYRSIPWRKPSMKKVVLYHAMPYGLTDWMRRPVTPDFLVNIGSVIDKKEKMLSFHASQKEWLDESQGQDSYLLAMRDMSKEAGSIFGKDMFAEGWRRHLHYGFADQDDDPLRDLLKDFAVGSPK